ncbi:pirin family protein [Alkaliphilus hydrothermalis]|uniref:Redox-sensitive bicupin YhaK (Pirin superfamily) n=1 Tax=Alkaliphilus hydrothermalis TaxID=1482730 RepID=A0ABS2NT26_9FIRM|nr:pirin family protein [Alkaliphilus hydrothermalis]MBM7616115.1 redox-sensitive bicupin YhaK (pirin superfamily) [Alkaliphilus hydrothermalis]
MIKKIDYENMGKNKLSWLEATYHFSFGDYHNPENMGFGALRVLNDDIISGNRGFETHPHRDMEIVTYVVEGRLTHEDSMGNKGSIGKGQVQYMSAGTGVYHSEHNLEDQPIRTLQIWILPDKKGHTPDYGDYKFDWNARLNTWLHLISSKKGSAPIKMNQDVNFYALELESGKEIDLAVKDGRQAYLVQIEGVSIINQHILNERDGMKIVEEDVKIKATKTSHILVIEMAKNSGKTH